MTSMKVHFTALGCRLNEAELEQWSQQFQNEGYSISTSSDSADLVVFNSCAVTNAASRKSRQIIKRIHRDNPAAKLIVTGCHASLNRDAVAETLGVDLVIGNQAKSRLTEIVQEKLQLTKTGPMGTEPGEIALYQRGRHRAFIKIQDGCRYRCTYCIVTLARGEEQSRSTQDIVTEINQLHQQGINEVVLTGVHVGGYGSDRDTSLYKLIRDILDYTDLPRLRLASVEPWDLPDNFFDLFANRRLMPHMHLPLQSGSDSVLKRMARRCKTKEFTQLVTHAREVIPEFNITTDIIAGFPGETEAEWQETLEYLQQHNFGHLHIFPYSVREGTKAARLPHQIDKKTKQARCRQLAEIGEKMKLCSLTQAADNQHQVLWEKPSAIDEEGMLAFSGYTTNYHRVETRIPAGFDLENTITPADILDVDTQRLILQAAVEEKHFKTMKTTQRVIPIKPATHAG